MGNWLPKVEKITEIPKLTDSETDKVNENDIINEVSNDLTLHERIERLEKSNAIIHEKMDQIIIHINDVDGINKRIDNLTEKVDEIIKYISDFTFEDEMNTKIANWVDNSDIINELNNKIDRILEWNDGFNTYKFVDIHKPIEDILYYVKENNRIIDRE